MMSDQTDSIEEEKMDHGARSYFVNVDDLHAPLLAVPIPGYFSFIEHVFGITTFSEYCLIGYSYIIELIDNLLESLSPSQQRVLKARYLTIDGSVRSDSSICRLGASIDDISRIETEALNMLRRPSCFDNFQLDFLSIKTGRKMKQLSEHNYAQTLIILRIPTPVEQMMVEHEINTIAHLCLNYYSYGLSFISPYWEYIYPLLQKLEPYAEKELKEIKRLADGNESCCDPLDSIPPELIDFDLDSSDYPEEDE